MSNPDPLKEHSERVVAAIRRGVRKALQAHQLAGRRVAVWDGDQVRLVMPAELDWIGPPPYADEPKSPAPSADSGASDSGPSA